MLPYIRSVPPGGRNTILYHLKPHCIGKLCTRTCTCPMGLEQNLNTHNIKVQNMILQYKLIPLLPAGTWHVYFLQNTAEHDINVCKRKIWIPTSSHGSYSRARSSHRQSQTTFPATVNGHHLFAVFLQCCNPHSTVHARVLRIGLCVGSNAVITEHVTAGMRSEGPQHHS